MNTTLVIVDVQQDYFPKGRMEVVGAVEASRAAKKLLGHFREKNLPVVHVQHISTRTGATFFLPNTEGINIHESVAPLPDETIIKKNFPNSFRDTQLNEYLVSKKIEELVICGMMSHMCIDATVRAAFDRGYTCIVAHDACATRNLVFNGHDITATHVHGAYMAALGAVYAKVLSAEEIIRIL
jgi:nicotinamidase-related amidase